MNSSCRSIQPEYTSSLASAKATTRALGFPDSTAKAEPVSIAKLATPTESTVAFHRRALLKKPCHVPPSNAPRASAAKATPHQNRQLWDSRFFRSKKQSHPVTPART